MNLAAEPELIPGLFWVTLHRPEPPGSSAAGGVTGYHLLAPLDSTGRLDPISLRRHRHGFPVLRYSVGAPVLVGCLRHRTSGSGWTGWSIDHDPGASSDGEGSCRLDGEILRVGRSVTLIGQRGPGVYLVTDVSDPMPGCVRRELLRASHAVPIPAASPAPGIVARRERPVPHLAFPPGRWTG
ncbi:hypothetical protein [Geminicoccus roseus]|uniref:hypothetical protein n=1 Tax=Geminicoccus roseus TaxID=404900 RepID=UPI0003F8C72D|nr:hypothetical protein [Geminicoccus roseus]